MTDLMSRMGQIVRDSRNGMTGQVIGVVHWMHQPSMFVVQPKARDDGTVPTTAYVPEPAAEVVPQFDKPATVN